MSGVLFVEAIQDPTKEGMMIKEPKDQCPLCKLQANQKHCKSPTCNWWTCFKHREYIAVYFVGDLHFVTNKASRGI